VFSRILIASRGEIALRIIRACKELGIQSVVAYSEADAGSLYLDFADASICIGPADASQSYLNIAHIIAAAEVADVDAIHPGYGFLAEVAHFAEVCRDCHIEFIGPSAETLRLMGNKAAARQLAKKVGVPVVPGSNGPVETDEEARQVAREIGFPVMIKASAGGGGRGMRRANNEMALINYLNVARSEAEAAFGDPSVYISADTRNSSRRPPVRSSRRNSAAASAKTPSRSPRPRTTSEPEPSSSSLTPTTTTTSSR